MEQNFKQIDKSKFTPVSVMVGRFMPFTVGHHQLLKNMITVAPNTKPCIAIVDRPDPNEKSPFSVDYIISLIKRVMPNVLIIKVSKANFLEIEYKLNKQSCTLSNVFAGADRENAYRTFIKHYPETLGHVSVKTISRTMEDLGDVSATRVRDALERDDYKTYSKLVPTAIAGPGMFKELQRQMRKVLGRR